jgi:hypothetical protein
VGVWGSCVGVWGSCVVVRCVCVSSVYLFTSRTSTLLIYISSLFYVASHLYTMKSDRAQFGE